MVLAKAFRGLATANLRSLRFSAKHGVFVNYLRDLEFVHHTYSVAPMRRVELAEIVGKDFCNPLFLPVGCIRSGSTPLGDLAALAALTQKKRPKHIFEIGTFEGLGTVVFAKNAGENVTVHTLDLPREGNVPRTNRSETAHSISEHYKSGYLIDKFGVRDKTDAHWGDSALFDFTSFQNSIDLFFVDGAHTEDYVALDTYHAFQCLAQDGWTVWHDCLTPQVMSVLKQIAQTAEVLQIRGTTLALVQGKPSYFDDLGCQRIS